MTQTTKVIAPFFYSPYRFLAELLGACDENVSLANKCEVATQTKPAAGRRRSTSLKKFVPYALGSSSCCTGEKLTFNVKSDCDVSSSF